MTLAFHFIKITDAWLEERTIISENASPTLIPRNRAQDIDGTEYWDIAKRMFEGMVAQK